MITLTDGETTVEPITTTTYEAVSESRNIEHAIIGRSAPDYSLGGESSRRGTLSLVFATVEAAHAAADMLAAPGVFTLIDSNTPEVDMTFIRQGAMRRRPHRWQNAWMLEVGFSEVGDA